MVERTHRYPAWTAPESDGKIPSAEAGSDSPALVFSPVRPRRKLLVFPAGASNVWEKIVLDGFIVSRRDAGDLVRLHPSQTGPSSGLFRKVGEHTSAFEWADRLILAISRPGTFSDSLITVTFARFFNRRIDLLLYNIRDANGALPATLRVIDRLVDGHVSANPLKIAGHESIGPGNALLLAPPVREHSSEGTADSPPRFLMRLTRRNLAGGVALVRACAAVREKYPRTELILLGDPSAWKVCSGSLTRIEGTGVRFGDERSPECESLLQGEFAAFIDFSSLDLSLSARHLMQSRGIPIFSFETRPDAHGLSHNSGVRSFSRLNQNELARLLIDLIEHPGMGIEMSQASRAFARGIAPDTLLIS